MMICPKCGKPVWIKFSDNADLRNLKLKDAWLQCSDVSHCDHGEWLVDAHKRLVAENTQLTLDLKAWQDREANIDEALAKQRAVPSSELVRELQAAAVQYAATGVVPTKTAASLLEDAAARIDALEQENALAKDHAVSLELADQNDEVAASAEAELADLRELRRLVEAFEFADTQPMHENSDPWWRRYYKVKDDMLAHVRKMREAK